MKYSIFIFILCLFVSKTALAGECLVGDSEYLMQAADSRQSIDDTIQALDCLIAQSVPYYVMGYKTPFQKKENLEKARALNSPHKEFVLARTQDLLDRTDLSLSQKSRLLQLRVLLGDSEIWQKAVKIVMTDQRETYSHNDGWLPSVPTYFVMMAGLGRIEAAMDWIVQQDREIKKIYKTKPIFSFESRMTCLNALAYIGSEESWNLLEKYASDPNEVPEIREHAKRLTKNLK